jgi:hypothetical protein
MLEVARRDGSQVDIRNCERGGELYRETYSHVPADNELLLLNVFDFDPRTAAPAGLVDPTRVSSPSTLPTGTGVRRGEALPLVPCNSSESLMFFGAFLSSFASCSRPSISARDRVAREGFEPSTFRAGPFQGEVDHTLGWTWPDSLSL